MTAHATIARDLEAAPTDIPFADCWITEEAQAAAARVLKSGWVTTGMEAAEFEAEFASCVGAARRGQRLVLHRRHRARAAGAAAGRPASLVLTSTMTFCGAVHAIVHAGLRPVLVDVDPDTGMPTPATAGRGRAACDGRPPRWWSCTGPATRADVAALAAAAGPPARRGSSRTPRTPSGPSVGGRPVGTGSGRPASASTPPRTCRSARAAWSPPTTPSWPRGSRRARLHGMSHGRLAALPARAAAGATTSTDAGLKANLTDLQAAIGRAQLRQPRPSGRTAGPRSPRGTTPGCWPLPGVALPHRPGAAGRHAWHLYAVQLAGRHGPRRGRRRAVAERGIGDVRALHPGAPPDATSPPPASHPAGCPGADLLFDRAAVAAAVPAAHRPGTSTGSATHSPTSWTGAHR